jgi:polyisoprenoid-binding protein YceI
MSVACARRNESQASSVLPLGSSRATSRWRRPATSDFEGTCIRNHQSVESLQLQVYPNASERSSKADEHADFDRCPGRYVEPRPRSFAGRLPGSLPPRDVQGEFHEIGAELTVDGSRASLEGTAKVASVDVKDENLSAHLQSPDFFDAERNPELRFAARDISLDGDGKVSVDGELTIKGVARPVAVTGTVAPPIQDAYGNDRIGLNLTTSVDRTDFGVDWNKPLPSGEPALANDATILAELQFVKPGEESNY